MILILILSFLRLIENVNEVHKEAFKYFFLRLLLRFVSSEVNEFFFLCNRLSLWSTVCSSGMLVTDPSPNSSPENRPQTQSQQFLGKNMNKQNYFYILNKSQLLSIYLVFGFCSKRFIHVHLQSLESL
jgi:hypothetical protein